jgi:hypothetical protein
MIKTGSFYRICRVQRGPDAGLNIAAFVVPAEKLLAVQAEVVEKTT